MSYQVISRRGFLGALIAAALGSALGACSAPTATPTASTPAKAQAPAETPKPAPTTGPTDIPKPTAAPTAAIASNPKVLMVLREHSEDWVCMLTKEVGVMVDTLGKAGYKVVSASPSGQPLVGKTTTFTPDMKLADVNVNDYVGFVVPCLAAGLGTMDQIAPAEAVDVVKKALATNKPMALQDSAQRLLDGLGCKTVGDGIIDAGASVTLFIQDRNVITSAKCPYDATTERATDGTPEMMQRFLAALQGKAFVVAPTPTAALAAAAPGYVTKPAANPGFATYSAVAPVKQPAGTTSLVVRVHWNGKEGDPFQTRVNEYNTTQGPKDGVYLAVEAQAIGAENFVSDYQQGYSEDVYHLSDAYLADLSSLGLFQEAPPEVAGYVKQTYLESAVKTGTVAGKVLGYPTENQPHCLFVNSKLFKVAGLDAAKDYPKTYADIRRLAKQLTKRNAATKTQCGWILQNDSSAGPDPERGFVERVLYQYLEGEPLVDDSTTPPKVNVTSPGARKYTQLLYDMVVDGSTNADMVEAVTAWTNELGAMHTQDAWAVVMELVWQGRKGIIDDTFTTGLRSSDGKKTGNISRNYHFLVSSKSKQKDLAWEFLKWLNQGPEFRMQHLMTDDLGFTPSVKGQPMPSAFSTQMKAAFADSMSTPYQTYMPVVKGLTDLEGILWQANNSLYTKAISPDEYAKQLDSELNAAIKKAYA